MIKVEHPSLLQLYNAKGRRVRSVRYRGHFTYQIRLTEASSLIVVVGKYNEGFTAFNLYFLKCCSDPVLDKRSICKNCKRLADYDHSKIEILAKKKLTLTEPGQWKNEPLAVQELEHAFRDKNAMEAIILAQDTYNIVQVMLGSKPKIGTLLVKRWA